MNIIVTGCAGFIGSRVAETLLEEGHIIFGIDSMDDAYDRRLKEWRLDNFKNHRNFRFGNIDITDNNELSGFFEYIDDQIKHGSRIEAVINLAARAGVRRSIDEPAIYYETNVLGVLNLLEQCKSRDIGKFVQASTSSVYGENEIPFREEQVTDRQLSPYASSKKASELLCYTYHSLYGLDVTVLRYFTVYGPAGRPDMSPYRFIKWCVENEDINIYGDGNQSRDFTYVDDIAKGTIAGLKDVGYEIVNLGSNNPVKLNYFLKIIRERTGSNAGTVYHPVNPADVSATWADVTKAKDILGWSPEYDIETGVANSVDWYLQNRDWAGKIIL